MSTTAMPVELQNLPTMGNKLKPSTAAKYARQKEREAMTDGTAGFNGLRLVSDDRMKAQDMAMAYARENDVKLCPAVLAELTEQYMREL